MATTTPPAPALDAGEGDGGAFALALADMMAAGGGAVSGGAEGAEEPVMVAGVVPETAEGVLEAIGRRAAVTPVAVPVAAPVEVPVTGEAAAVLPVADSEAGGADAAGVTPELPLAAAPSGLAAAVAEDVAGEGRAETVVAEGAVSVPRRVAVLPEPLVTAEGTEAADEGEEAVAEPAAQVTEAKEAPVPVAAPVAAVAVQAAVVAVAGTELTLAAAPAPPAAKAATPAPRKGEEVAAPPETETRAEAAPREAVARKAAQHAEMPPVPPVRADLPREERAAPEAGRIAVDAAGAAPAPAATAPAPVQAMAQPALPAQAPVAMDRPGWEVAITERIAAELSGDGQQIDLELSPEHLGRLKITLEVTDGQAQVRFVTETPEAARLIQQGEARLSESLSRSGLSLGGHDTASRDAQGGDRSGGRAPRGTEMFFERSADPRPGQTGPRGTSGLVNLMA